MINATDLHAFLGKIEGGSVAVDLLKIVPAAGNAKSKQKNGKIRLALDMEDCLDRFYGGYYSDWACGGQWNRAYQFVQLLANAFSTAQIEIIAFFDGTLRENKRLEGERNDYRQKTISVLKHIRMIGTPPPKIWWLPPSGLRTCLRNAMRNINIQVIQTIHDHTMEVIEYFHEHRLDGILGVHPDYIIANCSRYFSSHDLRLSYKGSLETKEYSVSKLLSSLSLTADHLPFVAVLLGGYVLLDEAQLKSIYQKLGVDVSGDFEGKIRKIAEIVRNSPTNDTNEFIKHLNLADHSAAIVESIEYYQRKGKFSVKKYLGNKKKISFEVNVKGDDSMPMASETSENDEVAKKILSDVNNLVDESESYANGSQPSTNASSTKVSTSSGGHFIYTLPGEVLKTSLNRHQRGMMDSKIYQLLTKKSIVLPQVLEDEQSRDVPSVHLFYRPARQMIYAILFNLYHQRYLCSKTNKNQTNAAGSSGGSGGSGANAPKPDVVISEWIWTPQNEYKKPEMVKATQLPWAVPTVQRLWFGMAFEDKQRRMKAFLTIMRSDSLLMLNRGYVPQHMLVMACVLRYMITDPDKSMLTRQELDAFLATAFSHQLLNVEYTQELVLPCVHLRGVYLATLFMQGVETASLANDACGIPLPWLMTNPWLFFDGKLFHLKLKMSTYVQSLRELCDDQIEIVLKIERFRKAILEDVEHYLLPAHIDHTMYRPGFLPQPPPTNLPQHFGKGQLHQMANIPQASADASGYYSSAVAATGAPYYGAPLTSRVLAGSGMDAGTAGVAMRGGRGSGGMYPQQRAGVANARNGAHQKGYQLKVGELYAGFAGVVVGSWAAGGSAAQMRPALGGNQNANSSNAGRSVRIPGRAGNAAVRFGVNGRGTKGVTGSRLHRGQVTVPHHQGVSGGRGAAGYPYGGKVSRNKNRKTKKEKKSSKATAPKAENDAAAAGASNGNTNNEAATENEVAELTENLNQVSLESSTVELQNGTTVLASDLANSMCDEILKEEESEQKKKKKAEVDGNATTDSDAKPAESSSGAAEKESASCDTDVKLKSSQGKGEIEKKLEENGSATSAIGQKGQEDVPVNN
ncbi:constitutive coactivator of PPAR-gamma-like protein 1 isoform X2 [Phlebotomus papatasi]|uniref:constitutive coactivator of PPAR-gamma-like protein 1 isoform X2 n=1 Tax=Phlebotomus papatasi TaxID=29031 RepID=UPI0024842810|nr:constitutive coactivator of PPAR-gamma-like protein 1 isoform X2 [Phlebotomus papatasi]XP_055696884.1 constitutive coactivator of PPAR-gamma-like protein 1 isoform X2 [Phlebotomus papatasi]